MLPEKPSGVSGVLGGIRSIAQLAQVLSPYFAPASILTPPLAQGTSGGRTVVLTTNTKLSSPPPIDRTQATLTAGSYPWAFAVKFNHPPVVTVTAVGAPPSAGTTLYLNAVPSATGVTIKSTDGTDARVIEITATGNPN